MSSSHRSVLQSLSLAALGKGRGFYTSMGHRDDVWASPIFQDVLTGGIRFALGEAKADVTPNARKVTPEARTNPPYTETKPAAPMAK